VSAVITAWASMVAGVAGADEVPAQRAVVPLRARWPAAPDRIGRMDRPSAHALLVAQRALSRVALGPSDDVGVIVGTALGCAEVNDSYHRGLVTRGVDGASPLLFAQTIPSAPAGELAIAFGLRGHSATVMAGRCAGIAAVAEALRAIRRGRLDAALVVVGDTFGEDRAALRAAQRASSPGEATVALLVEREGFARANGRCPRATLREARVWTDPSARDPDGVDRLGAAGLMELARWLDAGAAGEFRVEVSGAPGRRGCLCAAA
jgi:3-oxoacyl-(acyl-carrier-protein) synthase